MAKYPVKERLGFDGKDYEIDEEVEMTAEQAQPLIELGVLGDLDEVTTEPVTTEPPAGKPSDAAELNAAIVEAIKTLDKTNKELWTKDGSKPQVAAIEAALGYNISAGERDAAMALIGAGN